MRARVRVPVSDPHKALMVTERAIGTDQGTEVRLRRQRRERCRAPGRHSWAGCSTAAGDRGGAQAGGLGHRQRHPARARRDEGRSRKRVPMPGADGDDRPKPGRTATTLKESVWRDHVRTLLCRPPGLRHGPLGGDRHRRPGRPGEAAGCAVPRDRPADDHGHGVLSRRQRQGRGRHRGHADRAGSQRRREHDLHVVALHQRRPDDPRRHLQAGHQPGHGPGAGAEPRRRRRGQAARGSQTPGRDHQEEVAQHPAVRQPDLGEGDRPGDRRGALQVTTSST